MAIVNAKYEFIMVDVGLGNNGRIFRMEEYCIIPNLGKNFKTKQLNIPHRRV